MNKEFGLVWSLLTDQETLKEKHGITNLHFFTDTHTITPPKKQGMKYTSIENKKHQERPQ